MTEIKRRHYIANVRNVSAGKPWWQGLCACSWCANGRDRERVERELSNHIIRSNAADRLKEKGKPMITHHDYTRRVFTLEIPTSGTLAELEQAIDQLKAHADEQGGIVVGVGEYRLIVGAGIALSYSVNLG